VIGPWPGGFCQPPLFPGVGSWVFYTEIPWPSPPGAHPWAGGGDHQREKYPKSIFRPGEDRVPTLIWGLWVSDPLDQTVPGRARLCHRGGLFPLARKGGRRGINSAESAECPAEKDTNRGRGRGGAPDPWQPVRATILGRRGAGTGGRGTPVRDGGPRRSGGTAGKVGRGIRGGTAVPLHRGHSRARANWEAPRAQGGASRGNPCGGASGKR